MSDAGTLGDAVAAAARRLSAAGIGNATREARHLAAAAVGRPAASVFAHPEWPISDADLDRLHRLTARRVDREPLAYVLGVKEFWSLPLSVTPATLTPRPETETLVEAALALSPAGPRPARLLDLGTGSGCLLLAVLGERPAAFGVGVDRSAAAARVARANAATLGLADRAAFVVGDWLTPIGGRFDLVVANPPYVADAEIDRLEPEIARHEPRLALAGGADGLDAYRVILPELSRILTRSGVAIFEVGAGQASAVADLARAARLQLVETRCDLAGIVRCVAVAR
jgi:release factor glutamine methyltransferase